METTAVIFDGPNQVRFGALEVPEPRPDEALVQTEWSWISNGTEGSFLRGERHGGETPASAEKPAPFPIVAGYQRVGRVVAAGAESGVTAGQRVFVTITRIAGLAEGHGGHVFCGPVHRDQIYVLPEGGPPAEAYSGLVLTQVGWNCGQRPVIAPGDAAVVIGDGMVGQWSAQTLQQRGAKVMLLGRHDSRLARWVTRADDRAVNSRQQDAEAAVAEWAPEGVQAIIDTVGHLPTVSALFWRLRHNGHIASAGFLGNEGKIDIQMLRFREACVHAPSGWTRQRLEETMAWVHDGRLTTLPLVTHRLPATQAAEAWQAIANDRNTLGVLLDWRELS